MIVRHRARLIEQKPVAKEPVFFNRHGGRQKAVLLVVATVCLLVTVWLGFFAWTLTEPLSLNAARDAAAKPVQTTTLRLENTSASANQGTIKPVAYSQNKDGYNDHGASHELQDKPCHRPLLSDSAALAGVGQVIQASLFAFLPQDQLNGYLSFARNCDSVDVLAPEWFEVSADRFELQKIQIDSEMMAIAQSVLEDPYTRPTLIPTVSLAYNADKDKFLQMLLLPDYRKNLIEQFSAAAKKDHTIGLCLDLDFAATANLRGIEAFFAELKTRFSKEDLLTCSQMTAESGFWKRKAIVEASDFVVVNMYLQAWTRSKPGPLAPDNRFAEVAKEVVSHVGTTKLVMAIGNGAVDWVSGQVLPETISVPEALTRIGAAGASIDFSAPGLNSYSSFTDADGKRHQLWMLDAVSAYNNIRDLYDLGISNIGLADLGYEDPSIWPLLSNFNPNDLKSADTLKVVSLRNSVIYEGEGPFYRLVRGATEGQRNFVHDPLTGKIVSQTIEKLPAPALMQRYGKPNLLQVALTFDDGPDEGATTKVLDMLKEAGAPATFFIVGRAALGSPHLLDRMMKEGHQIGSHTFLHPHLESVQPWQVSLELNATQRLIAGQTGRNTRLFRPPYTRGSGPMTGDEVAVFATLEDQGYIVAGSDIAPPDWTGLSAAGIVSYVMDALKNGHGNVILLHDGREEGMNTIEAVPLLIAALREQGYEIVSLSSMLGVAPNVLMPRAPEASAAFSLASFATISTFMRVFTAVFWIFLIAGVARSLLYLVLASRRMSKTRVHVRSYPAVTIVIPAYNESAVILGSIQSALAADYPDLRIIVVDDGSKDDTFGVVQNAYGNDPRVKLISQSNQGKWMALNAAYQVIETEIAVCMDADTQIARDAIRHLVEPFDDWKIGAVAGTVLVGNKRNLLTRLQALEYFTTQNISRRAQEHINGIVVVPGALGAWRVEAVRDLGFLSNETLTEDTDLTIWMLRGNYGVVYAEKALAYTEAPIDIKSFLKQRLRWNVGILQSLWKHKYAFFEKRSLRLFSLLDLAIFGFLIPLLAPLVDAMILLIIGSYVFGIYQGSWPDFSNVTTPMLIGYLVLPLVDLVTAVVAFRFDRREKFNLLWVLPFQNIFYRQLLYCSVYRALFASITGRLASWGKLKRLGMTDYARKPS
jgi:cellulose synthase/poly-beta-1,6-N-acetylglucosamine synthase-like glycosyltransferase/peptidoglycan/xylan/chitin deacetylase (PgdA/CDA1 family)